jgi:hypothetical protein
MVIAAAVTEVTLNTATATLALLLMVIERRAPGSRPVGVVGTIFEAKVMSQTRRI